MVCISDNWPPEMAMNRASRSDVGPASRTAQRFGKATSADMVKPSSTAPERRISDRAGRFFDREGQSRHGFELCSSPLAIDCCEIALYRSSEVTSRSSVHPTSSFPGRPRTPGQRTAGRRHQHQDHLGNLGIGQPHSKRRKGAEPASVSAPGVPERDQLW